MKAKRHKLSTVRLRTKILAAKRKRLRKEIKAKFPELFYPASEGNVFVARRAWVERLTHTRRVTIRRGFEKDATVLNINVMVNSPDGPEECEVNYPEGTKTYKVPMFKKGDMFIVWTGTGSVGYFQEEISPLPNFVKAKLGIIMASPHAAELNNKEMSNTDFEQSNTQSDEFMIKFGKDYADIGWQYNKYYYCVVVNEEELKELQIEEPKK